MEYLFINTETYKGRIESVLCKHGLSLKDIVFVDKIRDEQNPWRIAHCEQKGKGPIIILKLIPRDCVISIKDTLGSYGLEDKVQFMKDDWSFVEHTVLHEVCHVLHKDKTERECDIWAFNEMEIS